MTALQQTSQLPQAQPSYILRGHTSQIHAVHFLQENTRLLTGDADGWVILWNLALKRPAAVWRPHKSTILGLGNWNDRIITHGRDSKLCVWQIQGELSTTLPVDDETERKAPWLLHSILVHTLNFCSFAMHQHEENISIAVPGVQDGSIIVISLPSEERILTIPPPQVKTGMIMAIGLYDNKVYAGFESGHAAVWKNGWQYLEKAHSQPILSLDILGDTFFTSSADAIIACHSTEMKSIQTKHAGQQSLKVRSDGRVFATAGWDGKVRVYSAKTMVELAVLKWHKEGCYAVGFATIEDYNTPTRTVAERRIAATKGTHWLAAGSKDGKISLWDIY